MSAAQQPAPLLEGEPRPLQTMGEDRTLGLESGRISNLIWAGTQLFGYHKRLASFPRRQPITSAMMEMAISGAPMAPMSSPIGA